MKITAIVAALILTCTQAIAASKSDGELSPQIVPVTTDDGLPCRVFVLVDKKGKPIEWKNATCDFGSFNKKAKAKK